MTDVAVDRPTDADGPAPKPNALPYTLQFVEATRVALPALQSFVLAPAPDGQWFVVGGRRRQGLHSFQQRGSNFPRETSDHCLWLLDPATGLSTNFETEQLPKPLAAALQATNQQSYYDREADHLYIVGGYGWGADGRTMTTFGTLIRVHVATVVEEMRKPQPDLDRIATCFELGHDDRFAVTGGSLLRLGDRFCLLFGQSFDGEYRAFGGGSFTQRYTEAARMFTLHPHSLEILAYGEMTSGDLDQPFHRRDGNFVATIDATTGRPCLTAFGGVFRAGAIAGFTHPIHFYDDGTFDVDRHTNQLFNQYTCPVVPIYDPRDRSLYHTFFGGISHHYHHETAEQARVREQVTHQGRNDGLPFVADVTTLAQRDGVLREFVLEDPTPNYRLVGTSAVFVPDPDLVADRRFENDVFRLDGFTPGERVRLGHVYGGIEADFPYPLIPNHGTAATNAIFEVHLDYAPSAGIPAGTTIG